MPDLEDGFIPTIDIILASTSKRRRELLEKVGVEFTVRKPATPVDETLDEEALSDPVQACKQLAERKAGALVQEILAEDPKGMIIVIGADTMVVKDDQIMGKPTSPADAKRMLRELSGCTHKVISAVSVWIMAAPYQTAPDQEGKVPLGYQTFADESFVTFKDLSDEEISDYLRKGESYDKAGAYAIQGEGAALVDHYQGSLDTIIGLPAQRLVREMPFLLPDYDEEED